MPKTPRFYLYLFFLGLIIFELASRVIQELELRDNYGIGYHILLNVVGIGLVLSFVGMINLYFLAKETLKELGVKQSLNTFTDEPNVVEESSSNGGEKDEPTETMER